MIQRRHSNWITHIQYEQGNKLNYHLYIEHDLVCFYNDLLYEPCPNWSATIKKIMWCIPKLVSTNHNDSLMRLITLEEVEQVVMEVPMGKSLDQGGITTDFFHHCWPTIKEEFWGLLEESRCIMGVLPSLSSTFITLIPKEENASNPRNFISIALCNIICNIITKIITSFLKPFMPLLISPEQSGYVEGR